MRSRHNSTRVSLAALACLALVACSEPAPLEYRLIAFSTVVAVSTSERHAAAMASAIEELEHMYQQRDVDWYPWPKPGAADGGSLTAANRAISAGQSVSLDPALAHLVRRGAAIAAQTDNAYSILTGRLQELWQDAAAAGAKPDPIALTAAVRALRETTLRWTGDELRSDLRNVIIDPGGIAKGALLADSIAVLARHGVTDAIVDLGGDLVVHGSVNGRTARIGIRAPDGRGVIASIEVTDGEAVMTSGNYERFMEIDGARYSHIIDPRSGQPLQHTMSATVIHADPLLADAAATALMVGGFAEFEQICRNLGLEHAMLVDAAGDRRLTSAMQLRVNWLD